jgi:hypothetical protein
MKFEQEVKIVVNGKTVTATVQLNAPGLETDDCLNPQMILAAVASGRNTKYHSRHHSDRVASVEVQPLVAEAKPVTKRDLRLVA